jgi:hypothetical protein
MGGFFACAAGISGDAKLSSMVGFIFCISSSWVAGGMNGG